MRKSGVKRFYYQALELDPDLDVVGEGNYWQVLDRNTANETGDVATVALCRNKHWAVSIRDALNNGYENAQPPLP